jgi:nucleotide-binding universal stress UspA family protein
MRAAEVAIRLAKEYKAELFVLNAIPLPRIAIEAPVGMGPTTDIGRYYEDGETYSKKLLGDVSLLAEEEGLDVRKEMARSRGSIVESIIDYASDEMIDLIVIGTRGLGGFKRLLLGSVSSGVVSHANCNVLVIR